jgi:hypothetical protein
MKKQSAVGKRAIWMGCDALAIVTPHTKEKTLMELELWSDVILGWDGNEVTVLKSRFDPLPLLAPIPVLRRVAASLRPAQIGQISAALVLTFEVLNQFN